MSKKKKSVWKQYLYYLLGAYLLLFLIFNHESQEINIVFTKLPKLPLALWLIIMLAVGFFIGRVWPSKKNKPDV